MARSPSRRSTTPSARRSRRTCARADIASREDPGAHAKTGAYALAALDHLDIGSHLDEFDTLRDLRNQSEYEALSVDLEDVREALEHATAIVDAIAHDL